MESSLEESNNNDNKSVGEDHPRTEIVHRHLDLIESSDQSSSPQKASELNYEQNVNTPARKAVMSPSEAEKSQQEVVNKDAQSGNGGNADADEYTFTEDQKRAMMELMTQTEEDADLLDEEPPEYNVKGRLIQLNEELANDLTPLEGDREHKVGFKPQIVDLAASPPPDYSDDEHHSSISKEGSESPVSASTSNQTKIDNNDRNSNNSKTADSTKKQYVVEQDGQFYVMNGNELESANLDVLTAAGDNQNSKIKQSENLCTDGNINSYNNNSNGKKNAELSVASKNNSPSPPLEPRPKSGVSGTRKNLSAGQQTQPRQTDHSPQPRSIGQLHNCNWCLSNFAYNSPYAMTSDQKAVAREEARKIENERKEKENKHKLEEEEKRRRSKSAFEAWLDKKMKEQENQTQESEKHEKSEQNEERKEAFKVWLREKKTQVKQERLLKRRQQQERNDWFFLRTREECEKAFKEWLKKKRKDEKKQRQMDRQTNRLYRLQVERSKSTLALIRALNEAQAFQYADYYGYRF